ncbi:hypothetical protein T492DRAFT_884574 [Pavlovales sp. CCMP2436]|nr:hypothetical protein T492DRAFT_884574 [Pavlovales sp. CCMP2436]
MSTSGATAWLVRSRGHQPLGRRDDVVKPPVSATLARGVSMAFASAAVRPRAVSVPGDPSGCPDVRPGLSPGDQLPPRPGGGAPTPPSYSSASSASSATATRARARGKGAELGGRPSAVHAPRRAASAAALNGSADAAAGATRARLAAQATVARRGAALREP